MNRAKLGLFPLAAALFVATLSAQTAGVRLDAGHPQAVFQVDGQQYAGAAYFIWPIGSKHLLEIATSQVLDSGLTKVTCGGWQDSKGAGLGGPTLTIIADASINAYTASCSRSFRLTLSFFDAGGTPPPCDPFGNPPNRATPGVVFVNGACYSASAVVFIDAAGTLTAAAYPYPGFVFAGWVMNGVTYDSALAQIPFNGDSTLTPRFAPAKRVKFLTDPPGLKVLVDRAEIPTPAEEDPCPLPYGAPATTTSYFVPRCIGVVDMAEGSKHVLAASTQTDRFGNDWVFDSFTNGLGLNGIYTAVNVLAPELITAKFVPGAHVGILTDPPGLKLKVDGRNNWPSYTFIWGLGTKHQIGAPAELADSRGRKWAFKQWSNGGAADQEVTVPADALTNPFLMFAKYELMPRLRVDSTPSGLTAQVDGTPCNTPCVIDRTAGTQVRISLPAALRVTDSSRLELASWSDGSAGADRVLTLSGDTQTLAASYRTAYLFRASADPTGGASLAVDPGSADGYYPSGSQLMLRADARPGYRFRRWEGDLTTSSAVATLTMNAPAAVRALLDRVPYISAAGVRNAAGAPADAGVAPGSIISIFGASLGASYEQGPASPLAQSIGDVTVRVNNRFLPLLFVSPEQINAQVPSDLAEGSYYLTVRWEGHSEVAAPFDVVRNAPGLFSNAVDQKPYALALHEDGSPVTPDNPARRDEIVSLFGTGFGPYERPVPDGFVVPGSPSYRLADALTIVAGDQRIDPVWSGAAPGFVGTALAKLKISDSLPAATTVEIRVEVNGKTSNAVLLPLL